MDAPPKAAGAGITPKLGQWVAGLSLASVPDEVIAHLKLCILDSLGCGLFGAAQQWGEIAGDVAVSFSGGGASSLFARAEKVSPSDAALANGTAIHGFELDDAHVSSSLHPGAVTLPAGLAACETQGASGKDLLVALAAGYEVGIRVGICAGVSHSTSGYHVTGTVGTLGAAACTARLLRLSPDQTAHAFGIAATQAAGLYSARIGAMTKRFHAGRASQSGVIAAYFARRGFTGSPDVLEAPFGGFMSTLRGQFDPSTILDGLGGSWETARVGLKAYAACASAHTIIDGIRDLRGRGLSVANLEQLTIRMSRKGHINVGWPYRPMDVITAQMNGSYAAAVTLIDGDAFIEQYEETRLADRQILALLPLIKIVHDPGLDKGGAAKRHAVTIDAAVNGGAVLSTFVEQRRGSAEYPLSTIEIEKKFRRLAALSLSEAAMDDVIDLVGRLEAQPDLTRLVALLTTSHARRPAR
jgi:2-methylcitrate dehydratase PrpD